MKLLDRPPGTGRHFKPDSRDRGFPMRARLPRRAEVIAPPRRRWRLLRSKQLDQGQTPQCVAYTGKHWEKSLPVYSSGGISPEELYHRCKARDGYPTMDGTDARAMMKVYQELGKVASYHWWTGDDEELKLWILTKGPAWLGIYLTEEMWLKDPEKELWGTEGEPNYNLGHEMCLIGYDRPKDEAEIVQSWGEWGDRGRARIKWSDLARFLRADGDAVGAEEVASG